MKTGQKAVKVYKQNKTKEERTIASAPTRRDECESKEQKKNQSGERIKKEREKSTESHITT